MSGRGQKKEQPVFDKHYHTNNGIQQYWEKIKILQSYAWLFIKFG